MILPLYKAMTATEFASCYPLPPHLAWMACHFALSGAGLTNLPRWLPEGSLLILDDQLPMDGHDIGLVTRQLQDIVSPLSCCGVLLDFQRLGETGYTTLITELTTRLPCPVAVTEFYAEGVDCPVFLSPVPLRKTPEEHLKPWKNREIWLEIALEAQKAVVTQQGCQITPIPVGKLPLPTHKDPRLHCEYHWGMDNEGVRFDIQRGLEELEGLLEDIAKLGITRAVGLYRELKEK